MPGLRERHAHMPTPALLRAPRERGHRAERHQETARVIDRLAGQGLWLRAPSGFGFRVIDAVRVLHQRVEAAPARPGSFVAVGAERDVDDARPQPRELLRAETVPFY